MAPSRRSSLEKLFPDQLWCSTLQRGGFLELQFFEPIVRNNHDGDVAEENPLNMLFQLLCEDAPEDLRDFSGAAQARIALQEAGFDDVEIEISRSRAFIGPHAHVSRSPFLPFSRRKRRNADHPQTGHRP